MRKPSSSRGTLLFVFGLSGCAGLIYETLWTHYLKLFLGHAAYAQTLVLAIFMGGMAIGAGLCSRYSERWPDLLRGYALAEGVIGVIAVVFHLLYVGIVGVSYREVIPFLPSAVWVTAFKWALGGMLILPQSLLLGMTFPLMAGGFMRRFTNEPGRALATLYFCNSAGGVIGVLLGGFALIPRLGLAWTGTLAGLLNIVVAAVVWRVSATPVTASQVVASHGHAAQTLAAPYRLMLVTSLLTGSASFIYEIGWIRMLSLALGSSTHSFELMLSAFILGLALGGLWVRRRIDRIVDPLRFLGHIQVAMGVLAVATLPIYPFTFLAVRSLVNALPRSEVGYLTFHLASHAIALLVMLPATFLAGTTLPLITAALVRSGHGESSIGAVYGANTVGAIVGITAAVHLGLPLLGLKSLIIAGSLIDVGVGVVLLIAAARNDWALPWRAAAAAAAVIGLIAAGNPFDVRLMASGLFRASQGFVKRADDVLFLRDGKTASVAVTIESGIMAIRTNGKVDASVQMGEGVPPALDEPTQAMLAAVPLLLRPNARTAANIGLGSGVTTHVLLASPALDRVDTIEIESAIIDGARRFRPRNERAYSDPRSHLVLDDAKSFFASQRRPYDIIVSEPSNPWVSGTASLFTSEFYRLIRTHLTQDGVFTQWLQLYEFDTDLVATVLKALGGEFEDYAIYAVSKGDVMIVAVNGSRLPELPSDLPSSPVAAELQRVGFMSMDDVRGRKVATKRMLDPWLRSLRVRTNSDYHQVLDDGAARARFLNRTAFELVRLGSGQLPLLALIGGDKQIVPIDRLSSHYYFPDSPQPFVALELSRLLQAPRPEAIRVAYEWPKGNKTPDDVAANLIARCERAGTADERQAILFELGWNLASFLSPEDVPTAWDRIESLPCTSAGDPHTHAVMQMFRAVGRREPQEMSRTAELLLQSRIVADDARAYVTAVGMLGYLAQGDRDSASAVWRRAQPMVPPERLSLTLAVLAAHASN